MLKTAQREIYKGFGLNILSDIFLPELPKVTNSLENVDIIFEVGEQSGEWAELADTQNNFVFKSNIIMFRIPNIAFYSIQHGNRVIVTPINGTSEDHVRLYLLGTCMGIILMQRRILPLHGSAIEINGKAYAVIGESGAGKSTLAYAFLELGYQFVSDDIIPISFSCENKPIVTPAYPQQKLWQESLVAFGIKSANLRPIIEREAKFALPVESKSCNRPLPLAGVFELVKTEDDTITITPINNFRRLHTYFTHTYRNILLAPSGLLEWHFTLSTKLANQIPLFQVSRPNSRFTAKELSALIVHEIKKGE